MLQAEVLAAATSLGHAPTHLALPHCLCGWFVYMAYMTTEVQIYVITQQVTCLHNGSLNVTSADIAYPVGVLQGRGS